jgi:acyl-CoA synthetase (AMP-forming)/AMP-acid ligase II
VAGFQAVLAAIYGGRTLAMMEQFDDEEWLATVERERVNRAMLVPTMLKRVIDHANFGKYDLSSLQLVTYGAASMPLEVIKKAIQVMPGVRFINAFGQTETSSTVLALGTEDHDLSGTPEEVEKKLQRLSSSIGKPLPGAEVAVLDEEGNPLGPDEVGVIAVKGQRVMSGYWKDAEKTAQSMTASGWLKTGDMGWQDEEGYFYLAGRSDDMIIRAGENISPEEVEQVLQSHPKVEEVAVIGVTDPDWGQQPRAIVVLKEGQQATAEELMEHCRSNLASFKRPRSVEFVSSLPRNPMGKVIRKALREMYGQP